MNTQNNNMNKMAFKERMDIHDNFQQKTLQQYSNTLKMLGDLSIKYDMNYEDYIGMMNMISTAANMERKTGKMLIKAIFGVGDIED